MIPLECVGCTQGQEIARQVSGDHGTYNRNRRNRTMTMPDKTKICSHCKQEKPLGDYHRAQTGKYGHTSICKECKSARAAQYWQRKQSGKKHRVAAPETVRPLEPGPGTLVLCFKGHEHIEEWLKGVAVSSFREPDKQVLYILDQAARGHHEI